MNVDTDNLSETSFPVVQGRKGATATRSAPTCIPGQHETVKTYMTKHVIAIQSDQPLSDALELVLEYAIGCIPVLEDGKVIGVITEQTLLRSAAHNVHVDTPVGELALPAQIIDEREPLLRAIERLRHLHARHLLIINDEGELEGLISQTDLLEASRRCLILSDTKVAVAESDGAQDALTGLLTRKAFDKVFKEEFHRARKYGGLLALLFLDLDNFKVINGKYGHLAGDTALGRIGRIIQHSVRTVDYAARYGGDEFVILMPGAGTRSATIHGNYILDRLANKTFTFGSDRFSITGSIGGCKWTRRCRVPNDMVRIADRCLLEAKRGGASRIEVAY